MESRYQCNPSEDFLEVSVNLDQTNYKEGYDEGYNHGVVVGKEEARQLGLKMGFEMGEELGFYRGCIDVWNSAIRIEPTVFSARVRKYIEQMEQLVEKYPILNPEDESVQETMDSLRLKFRIIRAGLGVKLEYDGYPNPKKDEF